MRRKSRSQRTPIEISSVDENGYTPLHHAVIRHDPTMVEQLLQGADSKLLSAIDKFNNSALHIAVKENQLKCVKVLLRFHCDVNLQNLKGNTALHLAIYFNNNNIINLLCNCERVDFTLQNKKGLNVLHYAVTLGNTYAVNRLVTHAPHLVDMRNKYENTALHLAAYNTKHSWKVSAILLSQRVRATVDLRTSYRRTPLHIATSQQNWPVVELLVRHNADISKTDIHGDTALHTAIRALEKPITLTPKRKNSPLIYAIWQNLAREGKKTDLALACFLISVDKSDKLLDHAKNACDITPVELLWCVYQIPEYLAHAVFLLSYNYHSHNTHLGGQLPVSMWVNEPLHSVLNRKPLHYAAIEKDPNLMEQLLLHGADINAVDKDDISALHLAVLFSTECVDVLLRYHCDVNLQNSEGNTALHWAVDAQKTDVINLLCDCKEIDFTLRNKEGDNVLHYAINVNNIPAVKILVTRAPHLVELKNKNGLTTLHMAVFKAKYDREILAVLLSHGDTHVSAAVNLSDSDQETPLHAATFDGNWPLVELLVHYGADISKKNCFGNTVLHDAIFRLDKSFTNTPKNRKYSPFIYAIWQYLAKQGAKTDLALACFLVSVDKSGKVLEHARNDHNETPLDMMKSLIDSSEFPRCAHILRCFNYYSHLGDKNSLGLMKYLRTREIR